MRHRRRCRACSALAASWAARRPAAADATVNVFIESAYFDPIRTARTGRKLGIHSDARYRFERGIDPHSEQLGINLATQMILEICGGETERARDRRQGAGPRRPSIGFDPARVEKLTGLKLKPAEITGDAEEARLHGRGQRDRS